MPTTAIRDLLSNALAWQDAHVTFDDVVAGIPAEARGRSLPACRIPPGSSSSISAYAAGHPRLLRRRQLHGKEWPDDYWPSSPAPATAAAWNGSIRAFAADRKALQALAADTSLDLEAKIPHGSGQTYLRELVLVIDHSAYHVGQLVLVRRLLGVWKKYR